MSDDYKGYKQAAVERMQALGIRVWSDVVIATGKGEFAGIVLPRSETGDDRHLVLKLHNGYNVGIRLDSIDRVETVGRKEAHYKIPEQDFPTDAGKPNVVLLGTGGTIASRLDYRTGAVIPAFSPGELYGAVPELADVCNLKTKKMFGIFSENMAKEQYVTTAKNVAREIENGADGIVIGHGTDTMHHTAAILTFMVQDSPVPIVMVGSQRSSDRPSSDAALNLINSTRTAGYSDIAEVMVCMFGPTSDQFCLLHRGTRVRKMHSSYRSTFRTIGSIPLGRVSPTEIVYFRNDYKRRDRKRKVRLNTAFEDMVTIVYYYPGMRPDMIDMLVDRGYKGIIIAGTGLGHVNKPLYPALRRAHDAGVAVFMTVQTLWGFTQMYVYDTGRDLMENCGVMPLSNMLPEVAFMKLCWTLGQTTDRAEVRRIMETPVNEEITEREPMNGYVVLQGGIAEVDDFISHHRL